MLNSSNQRLLCIKSLPNQSVGESQVNVGMLYTSIAELADMYLIEISGLQGYFPKDCFSKLTDVLLSDLITDLGLRLDDVLEIATVKQNKNAVKMIEQAIAYISDLSSDLTEEEN
jgi:hypothetical protein